MGMFSYNNESKLVCVTYFYILWFVLGMFVDDSRKEINERAVILMRFSSRTQKSHKQ